LAAPVSSKSKGPRVIVALDYAGAESALTFVDKVRPEQCKLKIGLELFTSAGPTLVSRLIERGFDVFLDLKFHDIPNTVAKACTAAARLGVWMLNVHTLGGPNMLRAAREAVDALTLTRAPLLVGVTLLTSHTQHDISAVGLHGDLAERVGGLAALAHEARLDGVVCSPHEAAGLRRRFGNGFVLVTPGIRLEKVKADDQARTMSPGQALAQGADFLVIGRPMTQAPDPHEVLRTINRQLSENS
jgi:orotidine-5'-phosphate decarboxylase